MHKVEKSYNPYFARKTQKCGSVHFQREYAWLEYG